MLKIAFWNQEVRDEGTLQTPSGHGNRKNGVKALNNSRRRYVVKYFGGCLHWQHCWQFLKQKPPQKGAGRIETGERNLYDRKICTYICNVRVHTYITIRVLHVQKRYKKVEMCSYMSLRCENRGGVMYMYIQCRECVIVEKKIGDLSSDKIYSSTRHSIPRASVTN